MKHILILHTMQALKFVRNVNEGGYKKYQNVTFNKTANTAVTNDGVFKVPVCVQDVVSAVFYARNIDFSKLHPEDKIAFSMFLDNEVYEYVYPLSWQRNDQNEIWKIQCH